MAERNIHIDANASIRDLLRLLDVPGDSIKVDVSGSPVVVILHDARDAESSEFETEMSLWKSALGAWGDAIDLDALERDIYEARDNDPVKPDVVFD